MSKRRRSRFVRKTRQVLWYESAGMPIGEPLVRGIQTRRLAKLRWARRFGQLLGLACPVRCLFLPCFVVLHFHLHAHPGMNAALKIVFAFRQIRNLQLAAL